MNSPEHVEFGHFEESTSKIHIGMFLLSLAYYMKRNFQVNEVISCHLISSKVISVEVIPNKVIASEGVLIEVILSVVLEIIKILHR